jgi:anti-sigma factor RsiW
MKHTTTSDFIKLAAGELDAAQRNEIERHLGECAACREEQRRFLDVHGTLGEWAVDAGAHDVWAPVEREVEHRATIVHKQWRTVASWSHVAAAVLVGIGLGYVIGRLGSTRSPGTNAPAAQIAELEATDGLLLHALESPSSAGLFPAVLEVLEPGKEVEATQ